MGSIQFPDAQPPYGFDGDPDIYGLGIRVGYYTQILSVWVANYWVPQEASFLHSINVMFLAAMLLAVGFLASRIPDVFAVEVFLLINISFSMAIFGTDARFVRGALPWETRVTHKVVAQLVGLGLGGYNLWFWNVGLHRMKATNSIYGTQVFWYAQGDLFGAIKIANQVVGPLYALLTISILMITVVSGYHNFRLDRCCTEEAFTALEEKMLAELSNYGDFVDVSMKRKKHAPSIRSCLNSIKHSSSAWDAKEPEGNKAQFRHRGSHLEVHGACCQGSTHSKGLSRVSIEISKPVDGINPDEMVSKHLAVDASKPASSLSTPNHKCKLDHSRKESSHVSTQSPTSAVPTIYSPQGLSAQSLAVNQPPPHPDGIPTLHDILITDVYLSEQLGPDRPLPPMLYRAFLSPAYFFYLIFLLLLHPTHLPTFLHLLLYLYNTSPPTPTLHRQQILIHHLLTPLRLLPPSSALQFATRLRMSAQPPPPPCPADWIYDAASTIAVCIVLTIGTELTLQWNEIRGVHSMGSAGQLVPFVLGVGGLVKVVWAAVTRGRGPGGRRGDGGCEWTCAEEGRRERWVGCAEVYFRWRAAVENGRQGGAAMEKVGDPAAV
ncbi:hypothetical protein P152DRAFT_258123 [Eremomyces bilateralis CBS 781.70]|uniref:Uncharacterized protein n=1 Tax=Eremomyces bilateralis CBS 781.70 TaxID=1392243 RepID=A0A6G1FQD9_9PEZI|nr:uncharacterized protein P152DRAFT_258123 [Eremomyces bilateralis CBS 781.70]KAF1808014.1 hypothetical protein P152DRAFT_258123 [Eremomyces bilateralis CBS 781.70]